MTGKLIDAEKLKKHYAWWEDDERRTLFNQIVDAQPTIDAEPVRHGKWIKADSQQYFRKHYPCFTCSECGYRKDSQKKWNYCPQCGARMYERKEE